MAKFRKIPVTVNAYRVADVLHAAANNWKALPQSLKEAYEKGEAVFLPDGVLISTLKGKMKANPGDWIIRGVNGEFYPCKPDIFAKTYEVCE